VIYLAIGCAALLLLLGAGGGKTIFKRREWRLLSAAFAIVAFAGAAYAGLRGAWEPTIVLVVLGLWLAASARRTSPPPTTAKFKMGEAEARAMLGVGPQATPKEIQAAYARLMRVAHPDKGGTDGLAAQLNAARDRLLKR